MVRVVSPFDAVTQAQLRRVRPRGCWRGQRKGWEFPLASMQALQSALGKRFHIRDDLKQWMAWSHQPLPPLPPHRELIAAADLEDPLRDGRRPLAHQRSGARWLLARRGAVLADEMGLGKTLTALLAARALARCASLRVLVVAPVGLHAHWQREADAVAQVVQLVSWARLPAELPEAGTLLLVDEAHFAQTLQARRTEALLRLARHPRLRAIWMLTGTPMKNGRPKQLFPLLAAIDHPISRDQQRFEETYCQGHWRERPGRHRQWQADGASQLEELRQLTRPLILHRRKQQVIGLPPKQRRHIPIVLAQAESVGFDHRVSLVIEDYRYRVRKGEVRSDAESLAVLTSLRRISAEFKLPAVCALLDELRSRGEAVVLFSGFVDPLRLLHQQIGGELLTGRQRPAERQQAVDRFQSGVSDLLLATYGTGGLGFTLHRARHVVLLERPWTPGDVDQAEDRCHRLGMTGDLICHWMQLGPADQLVDGLVASKAEQIEILLGPRRLAVARQPLASMVRSCLQAA
ncbi:MAG: DEAD/DEAH box helicase [Cyanobacteriota bacterium]|nr:DEAD/DEAH box helicase [Cyanobacteriota bacterium]